MSVESYVKFARGSVEAFEKLGKSEKNSDTLYFISDSTTGAYTLYLGEAVISSGIGTDLEKASIDALGDVKISDIANRQLLIYDSSIGKWINKNIGDNSLIFSGTNGIAPGSAGFVPAPQASEANCFLRSDGNWVAVESGANIVVDNGSITLDNKQAIGLKDFGRRYYEFADDGYVAKEGWKKDLEPRIVEENGQLVLGWFEKDLSLVNDVSNIDNTIKEIQETITNLATETYINELIAQVQSVIGQPTGEGTPASGIFAELEKKIDKSDTYTQSEIEIKINEAILGANHLQRKIVNNVNEIDVNAPDAEKYIYMVPTGLQNDSDKYSEYIIAFAKIGEETIKYAERVGSWEVDLKDYAKKEDLIITSVDENNFSIVNGKLELSSALSTQIASFTEISTKVGNLEKTVSDLNSSTEELNTKVENLNEIINNETSGLNAINGKISNLENKFNDYVSIENFNSVVGNLNDLLQKQENTIVEQINEINNHLTWQELTNEE